MQLGNGVWLGESTEIIWQDFPRKVHESIACPKENNITDSFRSRYFWKGVLTKKLQPRRKLGCFTVVYKMAPYL